MKKHPYVLLAFLLTITALGLVALGQTSAPTSASKPAGYADTDRAALDSAKLQIQTDMAAGRTEQAAAGAKAWLASVTADKNIRPVAFDAIYSTVQAIKDPQLSSSLATAWSDRCVSDSKFRGGMLPSQWYALAGILKACKQQDTLRTLGSLLAKDMDSNKSILRSYDLAAMLDMQAFADDSDSKKLKTLLSPYVSSMTMDGGKFRKDLAPFEIETLAVRYAQRNDKDTLQKLREFIVTDYLRQPGLAGALNADEWKILFGVLGTEGDFVSRAQALLVQEVRDGHIQAARLSPRAIQSLSDLMGKTDDGLRLRIASLWAGSQDDLAGCDADVSKALVKALFEKDAIGGLGNILAEKYDKKALGASDWKVLTAYVSKLAPAADRKTWADKCKAALARKDLLSPDEFSASVMVLVASDVRPDEAMSRDLLRRLTEFGDNSDLIGDGVYQALGRLLVGADDRKSLESAVVADNGDVRLAVFKTAAWGRHAQHEDRAYFGTIAGYRKAAKEDAAARWELARNYLVGIINGGGNGRKGQTGHIDMALVVAQSDSTKLQCLREAVDSARSTEEFTKSLQMVQSTEGQFQPASKSRLDQLKKDIQKKQSVWESTYLQGFAAAKWRDGFDARAKTAALIAGKDQEGRPSGQTSTQATSHRHGS